MFPPDQPLISVVWSPGWVPPWMVVPPGSPRELGSSVAQPPRPIHGRTPPLCSRCVLWTQDIIRSALDASRASLFKLMGTASPHNSTETASLNTMLCAASQWKSMGAATLHKSMGAASLHKSVGAASLHKSMGAASLHKSMGAASLHKSMGAASLHKSMGAAFLHKSMGAAS